MDTAALLIHGAGGGGWEWIKWIPEFERRGWSVAAPSLGPLPSNQGPTTIKDYVAQSAQAITQYSYNRLVLVGASMGGIIALKLAETLNPSVLVLVNSVPPVGIGSFENPSYPEIVLWANQDVEMTKEALPDGDESMAVFAAERWRDETGALLNSIRLLPVSPPKCPTLVVAGMSDTDVPFDTAMALAKWSGADLHGYHGMSHLGPLLGRRAETVARLCTDWTESHLPA